MVLAGMTSSRQFGSTALVTSAVFAALAAIFTLSCLTNTTLSKLGDYNFILDCLRKPEFSSIYAIVSTFLASVGSGQGDLEHKNVTFRSVFYGVDVKTLTKNIAEEILSEPNSNLQALQSWNKPHQASKTLPLSRFSAFLPPRGNVPGDPWWLLEGADSPHRDGHVERDVYTPPTYNTPAEELLRELFGMFHENVFLFTRAAPSGTAAVVVGCVNGTLDILFRSHIEYQISSPPRRPLWFTPAQFEGRAVISEDGFTLHHFEAYVPTDRQLNVDLEWLTRRYKGDVETTEVDIGKVAEMALTLDAPSRGVPKVLAKPITDARKKLDQMFFPFLKVPYHNLSAAVEEATKRNKLVHSIVTWGPLDDQSC